MSFLWTLTTSRLSSDISAYSIFLADMLDSVINRILTWTITANPLLRKAILSKITEMVILDLRAFEETGTTAYLFKDFIIRKTDIAHNAEVVTDVGVEVTDNSVEVTNTPSDTEVYSESTIYPEDYLVKVSAKVYESAPNVVLYITYDEYDASGVVVYSDSFSFNMFTQPAYPDDFDVTIDDSEWLNSKVDGVFC